MWTIIILSGAPDKAWWPFLKLLKIIIGILSVVDMVDMALIQLGDYKQSVMVRLKIYKIVTQSNLHNHKASPEVLILNL